MISRMPTGIEGLDNLMGGGFQRDKVYLISGEAGTGKTIFCLQYVLAGIRKGENAAYISLDEKPRHLVEDAESLGWDLKRMIKSSSFWMLHRTSPIYGREKRSRSMSAP